MEVLTKPVVAQSSRVVVHLEDQESVLARYLPQGVVYRHITLQSEAERFVRDRSVTAFVIDLILPLERDPSGKLMAGKQKSTALISRIRKERPEVPILVLTNFPGDDDLKALIKLHYISAKDVFAKISYDPEALVDRLLQPVQPAQLAAESLLSLDIAPSVEETLPSVLDPRLSWLISRAKRGVLPPPTPSTREDEIPVLAEVTDLQAWKGLRQEGFRTGIEISLGNGKGWIVTARVRWSLVEAVANEPFVLGLEAAEPLLPALKATKQETRARRDLLPALRAAGGGRGVVVGIVDTGCAFMHDNFCRSDATTRVIAMWNQRGDGEWLDGDTTRHGRLYSSDEINSALREKASYASLDYQPRGFTHATHVLDSTAGNGKGTRVEGIAWDSDLVVVDVDPGDVHGALGDSVQMVEAVDFIFRTAGNRPCVVNVSLSTNSGPRDGTREVDRALDGLVEGGPGRAVVVAAGNFYADRAHIAGQVRSEQPTDLVWDLQWPSGKGATGEAGLEVWYHGSDAIEAELLDPSNKRLLRIKLGQDPVERWKGEISAQHGRDRANGDNYIFIQFEGAKAQGKWCLRLHGKQVRDGTFHAWLRATPGAKVSFEGASDDSCTLGSLAAGKQVIAVAAYDANQAVCPICSFSSAGPTRDGRLKPELSAPGEDVHAARGGCTAAGNCTTCTIACSGTSMSAPAVTGVVALMLAEAQACGIVLSSLEIRKLLQSSVRPNGKGWSPRYGWGRLDARAAVLAVQGLSAAAGGLP